MRSSNHQSHSIGVDVAIPDAADLEPTPIAEGFVGSFPTPRTSKITCGYWRTIRRRSSPPPRRRKPPSIFSAN